jgi:hypothetical protein
MTGKLLRLTIVGLVGCVLVAAGGGCDSEPKPTIDTSSPFKSPAAPTTQKVEIKRPR